jgi:tetratricopeptide (TPR) repeat protein
MYGNVEKTPELKRADEKLFSDVLKTGVSRKKAAEKLANRGWEALKKEDPRTAIKRFNQSWLLDPNNGKAYWGFAIILDVRDKDTSGATEMFERARKLRPKDPRLLSDYGSFLENNGRQKKAIEVLRSAISINEKTPSAYVGLVKSYLALKDAKTALHYAQLGKKFGAPIDDRLISDLKTGAVPSNVTGQNGEKEAAALILSVRASGSLLRHQYDRAIKYADRAIRLKPDLVDAYAIRARAYSEMGQYDRAIKDADNVLRLKSDYAVAFAIRAEAYNGKRLYDRAIADADRALSLEPDMDLARRNKALALNGKAWKLATDGDENKRNGQQAVRLAEEAKRLNSDEPYIHGTLAADYAESGRFADAVASQERAVSMLQKAGNQEAAADFNERLKLYQRNKPYRHTTAEAPAGPGTGTELDAAVQFKKAIEFNDRAWKLATARDKNERDGKEAVRLASTAIIFNDQEPNIYGTLAAAFAETRQFAKAVSWQKRAIMMLKSTGRMNEVAKFQTRLDLYRQNKPYRQ